MKVNVEVTCTPEEARAFMGLPDIKPMQDRIMNEIEEKVTKLQQSAGRDKDAWKPSPMSRKLGKSTTSGATPTPSGSGKINNFFSKN